MILIETQKEEFNRLKDIRIFGNVDNEIKFNGDLLVLGLGGLGGKVVTSLKNKMKDDLTHDDNIHFLWIDSDIPAMEASIEDSKEGLGLNALEIISIYRPNLANILANGIDNNPIHPNLAKWMNSDFPALNIGPDGAKGNRQVGRLMFSNAYEDMRILLFEKLDEIYSKSATGKMDVIVVSGVAGGTGSGILSDVTYNIKAFAKSKKWKNVRVGGCLLMPDVLFSNLSITNDSEKVDLLNANGCATLKEVDYLMRIANHGEGYVFESTTHRLSMRENIFDSCMLVSGKKDEQGYIPEHIICNDLAYFLYKLASNKFIGGKDETGNRKLLRDSFFEHNDKGYFKVVNESDYKIPIKEIENICEYEVFKEVYKKLYEAPDMDTVVAKDINTAFGEFKRFFEGKPGEDINLNINGLIRPGQFEKPQYKFIKKGQDDLRTILPRHLSRFESDLPATVKSIKNKLFQSIDGQINKYMEEYGPFITMKIIGAAGVAGTETDTGIIAELKKLEEMQRSYRPTGEFKRIVDSILDIVSKRFFTFPSAKRETENGYFEACLKDAYEKERTMIIEGLDDQDVFGDAIRLLRQKAEHLNEVFTPFGDDLNKAVQGFADDGKKVLKYLLKDAKQSEFLPADYVTNDRMEGLRKGIINLMINHEADIDSGRVVPVKEEMEQIYKNLLLGVGAYGPEKLITVAFSDKKPTLQEINVMFVSPTNDRRNEVMKYAAEAFVVGAREKTSKKKLCILKEGFDSQAENKKFISLPQAMPYFSEAVKELLMAEPYNEVEESITLNTGEIEISVDDMFIGVPLSMLECAEDMQKAYDGVDSGYFGLHIDEVTKDMRSYPGII